MSLYTASLNSGSNGNCYYIGNDEDAILIDVGISCREVVKRMQRLGLSMDKVKAVFISHEHSDHISGLRVLAGKFSLPVYMTRATFKSSRLQLAVDQLQPFTGYVPVQVGSITVNPFPKTHDCADGHSFVISGNGVNIGVFTDIGKVCRHVVDNFRQCHAVYLETNYDEEMLHSSAYPWHLKKRISGGEGHLSNNQALELFVKHRSPELSHLFLSHLSENNNSPQLVHQLFLRHAGATTITVASRDYESAIVQVKTNPAGNYSPQEYQPLMRQAQLSLF